MKVLSVAEVRKRLAKNNELDKILVPRFVCTNTADVFRTEGHYTPPEPSARLVVPGFQDRANLQDELRRDSPTESRLSQHLLLSMTAWKGKFWNLMSCDVKAAFLKGDPGAVHHADQCEDLSSDSVGRGTACSHPEGCLWPGRRSTRLVVETGSSSGDAWTGKISP